MKIILFSWKYVTMICKIPNFIIFLPLQLLIPTLYFTSDFLNYEMPMKKVNELGIWYILQWRGYKSISYNNITVTWNNNLTFPLLYTIPHTWLILYNYVKINQNLSYLYQKYWQLISLLLKWHYCWQSTTVQQLITKPFVVVGSKRLISVYKFNIYHVYFIL